MATIKISCHCGAEIWTRLTNHEKTVLTLKTVEEEGECSDCIMAKIFEQREG
ncbi:hypothetical protein LCGC14_1600950 [marine sediment metagenome]|uniref:Uncharacterized protein n=1 Tax=marine sediment metagenome TaxID=412755 RepID=A0A0F9IXN1_9ZZZZ